MSMPLIPLFSLLLELDGCHVITSSSFTGLCSYDVSAGYARASQNMACRSSHKCSFCATGTLFGFAIAWKLLSGLPKGLTGCRVTGRTY
jgi:hypothetical protein